MTRVRIAALLALLVCLLVVPAHAAASSPTLQMLRKVNAFRARHGVRPVHLSHSLAQTASAYSRHMLRSGYFGHASTIHASRRYRTLGEIIEMHRGRRAGVGLTFRDWVNSPPHRSVMLMGAFRFAGAGFVSGRFHGQRTTLWTMQFGRH
jgi:uncharacterized protein YkwD